MKITQKRLKEIIKEEIESLNELDLDAVRLPSQIERWSSKLIDQIKRVNLTRVKQYAIVARIVEALGLNVSKLSQVMQIIKKDMKKR
jgi:hypothetical protein